MGRHPYQTLDDDAFWNRSISSRPYEDVDPVLRGKFKATESSKIATAGSCFAQNLANHLERNGFNHFVAEKPHPLFSKAPMSELAKFQYGVFSARYGNIYTAKQLRQLIERAYGYFEPREDIWREAGGFFVDPFRPRIEPEGFTTETEYWADREWHLRCVREMFENLDIFIFTLGLTECWLSVRDGATFPLCPGVAAGVFDPSQHRFHNQTLDEIVTDLRSFFSHLFNVNKKAKVLLTVSPVPLVATMENRSVLVSTTLSKSILRVACDILEREYLQVGYFPAYEIIVGNFNRGRYYADDLRSVTEEGVSHVMRLFFQHYANTKVGSPPKSVPDDRTMSPTHVAEVICEELLLRNTK